VSHIKDLVPDPANRRAHNPRNIGMVVDALHAVGAARSIVIDETNTILAGNGVTEAAAEAGITKVRVVEADGNEIIAVRRRGLTDEQKRALAIYDNRTGELASWNFEQLAADKEAGLSLQPFWAPEEEAALLKAQPKGGLTDPDDVPAERPTDIKPGDLFELGRHRLLCGDSTKAENVARVSAGETFAAMTTDPPYGIGYEYASHDDSDNVANAELVRAVFTLAPAVAKVWTPGKMNLARELALYPTAKILCWHKKFAAAGNGLGGASTWEPVLVMDVADGHLPNDYLEFMTDREPGLRDKHPCPKPVALWVHLLESLTALRSGVYEPFSGSGTSIIAAEQTDRRCAALEIEPKYCQVAIDRWEAFTGQKAVKVGEAVSA
jgi:hypothetical protein